MHSCSYTWSPEAGWHSSSGRPTSPVQLVLVFGHTEVLAAGDALPALQALHPEATLVSVSGGGEIAGDEVYDHRATALAMHFDATVVRAVQTTLAEGEGAPAVAARLVDQLPTAALVHVFLFSDGILVNGEQLAESLAAQLPPHVSVSGGIAAAGESSRRAQVGIGTTPHDGQSVAIGLYGHALRVGCGSFGGWDPFGPTRRVTSARGNVVRSLDGEPALALYKRYLGPAANELPASALFFPLALFRDGAAAPLVRAVMAVDEASGTLTFGGDIPEGATVRLMRANHDRLIDGAEQAATQARERLGIPASAAVLVSCVGRRRVLRQRIEDEIDGVRCVLGPAPALAGFYSFGEITPLESSARCGLHNQTMTVTALAEC